jgi:hypothetical protein
VTAGKGSTSTAWSGVLLGDKEAAKTALQSALEAEPVARRARLGALLRYIVGEELEGRGDRLKAFNIAIDVFERDETFDPQTDSIVRVEMFRLRKALQSYYAVDGASERVRIEVPKGSYRPTLAVTADDDASTPEPAEPEQRQSVRVVKLRADLAAIAAVALLGVGYLAAEISAEERGSMTLANKADPVRVIPASQRGQGARIDVKWPPNSSPDQQVP